MSDRISLSERTLLEMAHSHAWGELFGDGNSSDLEKKVRLVVPNGAGKLPTQLYASLVDVYIRPGMPLDIQAVELLGNYRAFAQRAFLNYLFEYALSDSTPLIAEQILDKVRLISSDWIIQSGRDLIALRDSITLCLAENSASVDAYVRLGTNLSERQRELLGSYENQAKFLFYKIMDDVRTGNPPKFVKPIIDKPRTTSGYLRQPPQLP